MGVPSFDPVSRDPKEVIESGGREVEDNNRRVCFNKQYLESLMRVSCQKIR
jgi:hypothetical protein